MPPAERWRGRALTAEAAAWLVLARVLIAWAPLRRWRARLGRPTPPRRQGAPARLPGNQAARRLGRAVERAARRLPGESRCLAQAIALHWLLGRRGLGSVLTIGVLPGDRRGVGDDLHAWVDRDGEVLIGASQASHNPLFAAEIAHRRG